MHRYLAIQPTLLNARQNIVCLARKCANTRENVADIFYFRPEWEDGEKKKGTIFPSSLLQGKGLRAAAGRNLLLKKL